MVTIKKDWVNSMLSKPQAKLTRNGKDYFLQELIQAVKGTPQGQQVISKVSGAVNTALDPVLDNALDKAMLKIKGTLSTMYILFALIIVTNIVIIYKQK